MEKPIHYRAFVTLLVLVSIAFAWLLWPLSAAVFWAVILAVIFQPIHKRISKWFRGKDSLAALTTLMIVCIVVILPLSGIVASLATEAHQVYLRIVTGEINFADYLEHIFAATPDAVKGFLDEFGITDVASVKEKISSVITTIAKLAADKAVGFGQDTFQFVIQFGIMLYLLFFFLRDGSSLYGKIYDAIPMSDKNKTSLLDKFGTVIKATVKGNIVVAIVQGILGGIIFAILGIQGPIFWGVLMACLSLLPAVGAGLVWGPVAIYFLVTGEITYGIVLAVYGMLVIGLVDNVLRPILVGKDTRMPDYLILTSTIGGLTLFGLSGFIVGPLIAALFIAAWSLFSDMNN